MKILVTGGAGFIGSAFVRLALAGGWAERVVNLDKLTYAGNLENLSGLERDPRYRFVQGDIADRATVEAVWDAERPDAVLHFAAESHVDRSILGPRAFLETNVNGTFTLLETARSRGTGRFVHVSTDEVYGSIEPPGEADEDAPLRPSSPYSASKAASDLLVLAYAKTYGLPALVTRASNNYGPYQFPEKLIPLMIANALADRPLPIYGDGLQVRDWLYVDDHCRALRAVWERGATGQIYNIGGTREIANVEVVKRILGLLAKPETLMTPVKDRPGHDRRYAITTEKLRCQTGWEAETDFEAGLAKTVAWYVGNAAWVERVRSGEYRRYYELNYGERLAAQ